MAGRKRKKNWAKKRRQQLIRRCLLFVGGLLLLCLLIFAGRFLYRRLSKTTVKPQAETASQTEEQNGDTAIKKTISEAEAGSIGWNMTNDGWWYQEDPDTQAASGWKTIDGKRYYFDADGIMATGWIKADGVDTYFDADGNVDLTRGQKRVALTFEDGPSEMTADIFALLQKYQAKATFFVVGERCDEQAQALLREMHEAGMELGNHTYDHRTLSLASYEEVVATIDQNDALLEKITGKQPALLRPTSTSVSDTMNAAITKPMIFWDVASGDWTSADAAALAEQIITSVQDGSIVQLHDLAAMNGEVTTDVLEIILPKLQAMGYRMMTVSEMANDCGYSLEAKTQYRSFYPE